MNIAGGFLLDAFKKLEEKVPSEPAVQTPRPTPRPTPRSAPTPVLAPVLTQVLATPTPTQTQTPAPTSTPRPASEPRPSELREQVFGETVFAALGATQQVLATAASGSEGVNTATSQIRDLRRSPSQFVSFAPIASFTKVAPPEIKEESPDEVDLATELAVPTGQAPVPVAEQAVPTQAAPAQPLVTAKLAEVSQLSDDLLYNMLESISDSTDSTLLPNVPIVLDNIQKNIGDDDNYLLSFKQYGFNEEHTDYQIYYNQYELSNVKPNFIDKSFNYFVYSDDENNVKITPITKYYTLKDILKQIYKLFDNIIIISKNISSSPISVLYQYKDYTHNSLIFIYDSNNNEILKNIEEFIDIAPENTLPDNPISIDEYNSIKTDIYG
jgi:hypothetical protein